MKNLRFPDHDDISLHMEKEKGISYPSSEGTLNLTTPVTNPNSVMSSQTGFSNIMNKKMNGLSVGSSNADTVGMYKLHGSNVVKETPTYTTSKVFATPVKRINSTKAIQTGPYREQVCSFYFIFNFHKKEKSE